MITDEMRAAADKARNSWLSNDANDQIGALNAALDAALAILPEEPSRLQTRPVAFEVLDTDNGTYLTRSEQAAVNTGFEYHGLYRRDGSAPAPLPVAVKALEWFRPESAHESVVLMRADSPFGQYEAWGGGGWNINQGRQMVASGRSLEAAQAGCQADFESRMRPYLSSPVGGTEEIKELQEQLRAAKWANEHDRSTVCDQVNIIKDEIARRSWLCSSRGSYEWDDERYQQEFSAALEIIGNAVDKLSSIASDWVHCPETDAEIQAARASALQHVAKGERQ